MKIIFFLVAVFLGINVANAQNDWVNYKIGNKLSVKLPKQPIQLNEHSVYFKDKDTTVYVITTVDMSKTDGLDSAKLVLLAPTIGFANQVKNSLQNQMKGSSLGDMNIGKWNGYTSYCVDGSNSLKKTRFYTLTVVIGTNLYGLMILLHENQSDKIKDEFFGSLKLN